jgi:hypothetical protein
MNESISLLGDIDRLCGQFATAMAHAEWQIYATLTLVLILTALLFRPKNDPDQI